MVGEVDERRPNGFDTALEEGTSLDGKNSGPHHSNESCCRWSVLRLVQITWPGYTPLMQIAGNEPYMPKTLRTATGKGIAYLAPILPVSVMTTLQMAKPKKTIGMVSRAVKPRAMTEET